MEKHKPCCVTCVAIRNNPSGSPWPKRARRSDSGSNQAHNEEPNMLGCFLFCCGPLSVVHVSWGCRSSSTLTGVVKFTRPEFQKHFMISWSYGSIGDALSSFSSFSRMADA
eukprot:673110-Amphidinium_carterae.1